MNTPAPHFYDAANAARLARLSAQAYASQDTANSQRLDSAATDTRAVITNFPGDRIVAFRGTADLRNWLTDLDCATKPLCWAAGKVHRGFDVALESIAAPLDAALDPDDTRRLWITGHSLGGALAMLFALRLTMRRGMDVAGVYTFGQPRVGNIPFSLGYDKCLKARTWRVVHAEDIVPRIPWRLGFFRHAGHEVFYPDVAPFLPVVDRPFWARWREVCAGRVLSLADHPIGRYLDLIPAPTLP